MKSSSATRLILFLLFAIIAFVAVVVSAEEDAAPAKSKCPLAGKCPYVKEHPSTTGEETGGCPLKKGGCPYYDQHKGDASMAELFTAKGHKCPLAGKCPFYDDIKAGKEINFDGKKCPIADKCPYYKEVKENKDKAVNCPLEKACPHFKKDFAKKGGHAHHAGSGDSHSAEGCPYLKKEKEKAAAAAAAKEHSEL